MSEAAIMSQRVTDTRRLAFGVAWVAFGACMAFGALQSAESAGTWVVGVVPIIAGMGFVFRALTATQITAAASSSLWTDAWMRLKKNRMAVVCGAGFLSICLFAFIGPVLANWLGGLDPTVQDVDLGPSGPSFEHWLGTDALGRDMLVRTMVGGQIAITVGLTATVVALVIGVSWGAIAAYAGGRVDEVMMRFVDVMYAFPRVVFVIVIMAVLQTKSLVVLFALIGAISWLNMARIVRGQVLSIRNREFVEAARSLGAPTGRIVFRHIVPNTMGVIIVYSTLSIPSVMLTEAFLSFIGLGVQAPLASWGTLVTEGASQIVVYPWVLIGPGLVMGLTIFALNFLGDGLRDALDPQMRKD
jgi:oligopeptide transport system permease protein